MKNTGLFQTRVIAILAASAVVALLIVLVAGTRDAKMAETPRPAAQPAASPKSDQAELIPPANVEAVMEPQAAPRPPANTDLNTVFPPSRLPEVATAQGARVSLDCLARNGADLSKPMPSKHCVFAANEQVAAQIRSWAQASGFEVRDTEMLRGHNGAPEFRFNLVRLEVPVPENIEREGRLILATVQKIPGAYYQTWSGEIVR